jgi:hypothetical protein
MPEPASEFFSVSLEQFEVALCGRKMQRVIDEYQDLSVGKFLANVPANEIIQY